VPDPSGRQVSKVFPLHLLELGRQVLQSRVPALHPFGQLLGAEVAPSALQVRRLSPTQRLLPGMHMPPHWLPTQAFSQGVGELYCPWLSQVWMLRFPWHTREPGTQKPPHDLPTQAFWQGLALPH
jgi:hypothetical protein